MFNFLLAAKENSRVNIHPCHIGFTIALNHAYEFPVLPLIKFGMFVTR